MKTTETQKRVIDTLIKEEDKSNRTITPKVYKNYFTIMFKNLTAEEAYIYTRKKDVDKNNKPIWSPTTAIEFCFIYGDNEEFKTRLEAIAKVKEELQNAIAWYAAYSNLDYDFDIFWEERTQGNIDKLIQILNT